MAPPQLFINAKTLELEKQPENEKEPSNKQEQEAEKEEKGDFLKIKLGEIKQF